MPIISALAMLSQEDQLEASLHYTVRPSMKKNGVKSEGFFPSIYSAYISYLIVEC